LVGKISNLETCGDLMCSKPITIDDAVSTVGFDVDKIRDYIRRQEHEDHEEDQGRF